MSTRFSILYEDNHLLIVNKPNGVLSQGDHTKDKTVVDFGKSYIKEKYNKPGDVYLHPVTRIDRPVSGAIILARTSKALTRMTTIVRDREIQKRYVALVDGVPELGEVHLTDYLVKDSKKNKVSVVPKGSTGAKKADLTYQMLSYIGKEAALSINLHTGRPHQIRVQLANQGLNIVGDGKYGYRSTTDHDYIYLHCLSLAFVHPVKKTKVKVKAPLPQLPLWSKVGV